MTTKTSEELLRPRYLVKTPWPPFNNYQEGDIVTPDKFTGWHPKDYPVIFRELGWWEHRSPEEMPEYVNYNNGEAFYKVIYRKVGLRSDILQIKTLDIPLGGWETFTEIEYNHLTPATLEEYTNYITTTPSLPGDNNKK